MPNENNGILIRELNKSFGEKRVISDLSAFIPYGKTTVVRGVSGAGKTTLLRMIAGLEKPDSGLIEGIEDKKTAFLFQDDRLFPWLTALQNVEAVITDKSRLPLARQILTELGLGSEKDLRSYPSELSGGMLRRVAIARTLAYGADVLIFDEALRGLDVANVENTVAVIKKYTADLTLISVTHTPSDIEAEAENVICV